MAKNNSEKTLAELRAEAMALQKAIEEKEAEEREKKKKEEAMKKAELERTKEIRRKAIMDKEDELAELIANYIKDYGSYRSERNSDNGGLFPYLWHMFL